MHSVLLLQLMSGPEKDRLMHGFVTVLMVLVATDRDVQNAHHPPGYTPLVSCEMLERPCRLILGVSYPKLLQALP